VPPHPERHAVERQVCALGADGIGRGDALADYASEQFEVACYTALVSAATQLGYEDVAVLCRRNLREDEAMAAWLLQQLPAVVSRDAIGAAAARGRA
jgi:ferritin-like metal-binding protein YciE